MKVSKIIYAKDQNPTHVEVSDVLEDIRSCKLQLRIDELRKEKDKDKNRQLKSKLPAVIFAGIFNKRGDNNIIHHSSLCVLDIDHIGSYEEVEKEKEKLKSIPYVYAAFVSPNGDGLKVVVRIPSSIENHYKHYAALMVKFPQTDSTSQNLERICFMSCDKNIYINYNAVEFTEMVDAAGKTKKGTTTIVKIAPVDNYVFAERALNMIRNAPEGKKHIELLKASRLMGGFISGGVISEIEGIRLLEKEVSNKPNITSLLEAFKTIKSGVDYGKSSPISNEKEFHLKVTQQYSDIDEVWEDMKHTFINGKKRGSTTYFPLFDKNFSWKEKDVTLVIGSGNAGKTEFITQLMLIKSLKEDWKWAVFTPENYPADEFYDALIHALVGKSTDPYFMSYQMTMDEYKQGYDFIRKHFFYVYPPEDGHNIEEIETYFHYYIENEKINGVLIDPFNQLDIDFNIRDDQFLSQFIKHRKNFAKKHNIHYIITSHPKTLQRDRNSGEYPVVNIFDIAGGAMWSNKVDNILSVHRPNRMKDPSDTSLEIHILKIKKHKLVGIPGICPFDYSRSKNRYYQNAKSPFEEEIIKPTHEDLERKFIKEPVKPHETISDKEPINIMPF